MSAADVLARHRYGSASCDECAKAYPRPAKHAAHQLDALKAAGYAVVELPKQCLIPIGWGDDCLGAWPSRSGDDPVSAWPIRQVVTPDDKWISTRDARSLAVALLAAADAAEARS